MIFQKKIIGNFFYYYFNNQQEQIFEVLFKPSFWFENTFAEDDIFEMNIRPLFLNKNKDATVSISIEAILQDFLHTESAAISYICDNTEGQVRAAARAKLFVSWFDKFDNREFVHLHTFVEDKVTKNKYYNGIVFAKNHELVDVFPEIFKEIN